jgi:hypothetical protein
MMMKARRKTDAALIAKIALARHAGAGDPAQRNLVHPKQIYALKKQPPDNSGPRVRFHGGVSAEAA